MRESIRLGRIAGVNVGLNLSVLVVVAILVLGLATGRFPEVFPGESTAAYWLAAIGTSILFFASLLAHEVAHAVVAQRNGIEVEGITLWLFGGVAQLKGEPKTPGADFRIAVVGPLTSLAVAIVFGAVAGVLDVTGSPDLATGVFAYLSVVNVMLAGFNLIPAAPLDGGRVLRAALWKRRGDRTEAAIVAARSGRVFGFALTALGFLQVVFGASLGGLWLVLIGLFLVNAASAEEQQTRIAASLHGVRVADVMTTPVIAADPDTTLDQFIARTAWAHRHSTYPLLDARGRLRGLATLNRVRAVPADRWPTTRLGEVACGPDEVPVATPDELLVELLPRMQGCTDGRAVVVNGDKRVIGIVSPSDISRAIQLGNLAAVGPYQGPRGADMTSVHWPHK
jgi:Zn-dependent protease/predicted transcriptional regulator